MSGTFYDPDGVEDTEDDFGDNTEQDQIEEEPYFLMWGEFPSHKFDQPTNRWDDSNYEPSDWDLFLEEGDYE